MYPTELQQWKESATAALSEVAKDRVTPQQSRDARKRINPLREPSTASYGRRSLDPVPTTRHDLYITAQAANPRRWAWHTRNWQPIAAVTLNPERESIVNAALSEESKARAAI